MTVATSKTALLLLDYQVALCQEGPHMKSPALVEQIQQRGVLRNAGKVLQQARAAELFIAHVRLAFDPTYALRTNRSTRFDAYPTSGAMLRGSAEAQIVDDVAPIDGEPMVDKGCIDPFIGTPLLHVLHAEGIRRVVMGGVATNLVVESAARHATDAGFDVTVIEDMCASFDPDLHDFSITKILPMFATVRSSADLLGELS